MSSLVELGPGFLQFTSLAEWAVPEGRLVESTRGLPGRPSWARRREGKAGCLATAWPPGYLLRGNCCRQSA